VGAGAIGSAVLFLLYPHKKPVAIVGTDIAHAVPLTAIAGMGQLQFLANCLEYACQLSYRDKWQGCLQPIIQITDHNLPSQNANAPCLMLTLSIMLVLTSIIILIKGRLVAYVSHRHGNSIFVSLLKAYRPHITVFSGIALGILVTISSVGAGAIGSAVLFLLYPHKKPVAIVGTDIDISNQPTFN
jgi:hypothetical protein